MTMKFSHRTLLVVLVYLSGFPSDSGPLLTAQPPRMRRHTALQKGNLYLVPANQTLRFRNHVSVTEEGSERVIRVNGIPNHKVGAFPNRGNPHSIAQHPGIYRVPLNPRQASQPTSVQLNLNVGIAVNGVLFDPGAAEFWLGNPRSGWQYDALGAAVPLGLDANFAHVQPDGNYHYHGLPTGLMKQLGHSPGQHSPLIGWAADGFPIYAVFGFENPDDNTSRVKEVMSAYRLKKGTRSGGRKGNQNAPGGTYDGAFVNDYEFVPEIGDLDECNGRVCVTPEYPEGTYAYFLTTDWPVIPRKLRGTPHSSFQKQMGPPRGRGRPPGRRNPPPDRRTF